MIESKANRQSYFNIQRSTLSIALAVLSVFLSVFTISFLISPIYTGGDQVFYREFYEHVGGISISEAFELSLVLLASSEPVYILITWLVAEHVDKDIFMSLCNGLLAAAFLLAARRAGANRWQAVFVIFSSFYFHVLYFAAERLKFAFIFLFLAYALPIKSSARITSLFLSIISHAQLALIAVPVTVYERFRFHSAKSIWRWLHVALLLSIIGVLGFHFADHVAAKVETHASREHNLVGVFKLLPFMLFSVWYSRTQKLTALFFALLFVSALLVGPERIVILGYFIFAYVTCKAGPNARLLLVLVNCYFCLKGLILLEIILERGVGFDDEGLVK